MFTEDYSKVDQNISQACNEFVVGLLSSITDVKKGRMPNPQELEEIEQLWQQINITHIFENIPDTEIFDSPFSKNTEQVKSKFLILSYFLSLRGEGYPKQLWDAAIENYSPHNMH